MKAVFLALAMACAVSAPALDWQPVPGGRSAALVVPAQGRTGFTLLPGTVTGIDFTNLLPQSRHLTNQVLLNGSGVAAGDVDGDGWCDVYFCGLDRPNALYRNRGDWKFEDIAALAGVACAGLSSTGAALADLDGDGDLDLVVNTVGHGTRVFFNDGRGRFTEGAVINRGKAGMSLALGDLNDDGVLDLYVANYRTLALMDMPNTHFNFRTVNGRREVSTVNGRSVTAPDLTNRYRVNARGGIEENGEADEVFLGRGGSRFESLTFTEGAFLDEDGRALAQPPLDWGLSVMMRDLNQDGRPDLWVCNDFDTSERVWLNQGGGRFRAAPRLAFRKTSHFSMGLDVADFNRDGRDDIFVVDMLARDQATRMDMMGDRNPPAPVPGVFDHRPDYMVNTLFLNRGDGTWAEVAFLAGLAATDWSWTPMFLDVDLDGWEDVLVANGHERAARSLDVSEQLRALRAGRELTAREIFDNRRLFPRQPSPNCAFRNRGDLTFEDRARDWGFDFNGVSHGLCAADLDNDGDLDVLVNNLNDPAGVYRNESAAPRLAVRLRGKSPNTRGIGARITVRGGAVPAQSQEMLAGGRYLSSDDPMRVFAAGTVTNELTIEVLWRSGRRSLIHSAKANHACEIDEAAADGTTNHAARITDHAPRLSPPLFTDATHLLLHTHADEPFDDHARQPTLPNRLSQLGPGVSWFDVDGDGWDDLIVGSGKGGKLGVFRNNGRGGFERWAGPTFDQPITRDQTTVLGWRNAAGQAVLLAGSANYEDGFQAGSLVRQFKAGATAADDSIPAQEWSPGPMALADVDGDGDLDLFVGGRVLPGRHPRAASSLLLRNNGDKWVPDAANHAALSNIGLASGAVFTDLDGDGDPDLALACEWGPLRFFRNDRGKLALWDPTVDRRWEGGKVGRGESVSPAPFPTCPLSQLTGWWNGITAADFDGDGRMDLAASNWGRNTKYERHRAQPLRLYHADFDGDGAEDSIEAIHEPSLGGYAPMRQLDFLARVMPFLRERFAGHTANREFGRARVEGILGERLRSAKFIEAAWLESAVLLNRGDHFEVRPLPIEAQFAPAFAVCAADFDGDGAEDLFLSQNYFAMLPDTPRCDAGLGLVLRGDGRGSFRALTTTESGVAVHGEQRGAAVCDYDGDGRVDLAVSQNAAATRLYRNAASQPGLRVRLLGSKDNSSAVGASARLVQGGKQGPAREVRAGSGYWSQDSSVLVFAAPTVPAQLLVTWNGGRQTRSELPAIAREVEVDAAGRLRVVR